MTPYGGSGLKSCTSSHYHSAMQALKLSPGQNVPQLDAHYPDPTPAAGEVVIRPTRLGVCSTDLELCKGYMGFNGVLGHEFVGIVESAADTTGQSWVGKRVVGTINCPTAECDFTRAGIPEHARSRTVLGILGRDGCFADRFTLPAANLLAVPDHVDDDRAVFTEPLAAAFEIPKQIDMADDALVTVIGDGRLGLLCAQVLALSFPKVRVVGKHPVKLALCEKWGIPARPLDEITPRQDQDIVVDATGSRTGLPLAMQLARPRGIVVMKTTTALPGPNSGENHIDLSPIVINELSLLGSRCGPFATALDALSADQVDVMSLISRRMKLSDGPELLSVARQRDVVKVVFEP